MVSIWFEGIEELAKVETDLARSEQRIGAQGAALVRRTALAVEGSGKQLVRVDTGATRASIGSDFTGDGRTGAMEATIGPTTNYSPFLEYGTSRMAPQPFMMPALEQHQAEFLAAVEALADPLP